jgi:hypothetical protein
MTITPTASNSSVLHPILEDLAATHVINGHGMQPARRGPMLASHHYSVRCDHCCVIVYIGMAGERSGGCKSVVGVLMRSGAPEEELAVHFEAAHALVDSWKVRH